MARRIRISSWYVRIAARLDRPSTGRLEALGRTIRALAASEELPAASDYQATIHPTGRAWVRRIGGRNMWLWYRFDDDEVILITVTTDPPVPIDE